MKIAVTATGKSIDSKVDQRFGRAAFFIIADTDTMDFEVIENENTAAAGGAGISSAKTVIDAGVEAVLTGNCGPNAQRTLRAAGVKLFTGITGTVEPVIELFKKGELTEANGPSVKEHFGMGAGKKASAEPDE
jgi:predicted Fe-Mo cluster-binding NifX family protein